MTKRALLPVLAGLLTLAAACVSPAPETPPPLAEPFRVLILGDSISIGYTPHVRRILDGRAVVVRPMKPDGEHAQNCQGTTFAVAKLEEWLAIDGGGWDVIHFNFGLHDLKRVDPETGKNSKLPGDPHQASPAVYERQLSEIVTRLQATGARLVFATTTPVPSGDLRPYRTSADAIRYNAVAQEVMSAAGVPVNDLYAFALPGLEEIQKPSDVHFTRAGYETLAQEVATQVLARAGQLATVTP